METAPPFLASETSEDVTIATTFDPRLQSAAEEAVAAVFEAKVREDSVAQAAVVVMDRTGAVRAMVGGRERGVGQFNRATQALRQTGSAFKPVVYAAALETGMSPDDMVRDAPVEIDGWSPSNYGGGYAGPVTLREALARSINTVAARLYERAGGERVRETARALGLDAELAPGPALSLGTSEATLADMTGVYATIANEGERADPHGIVSIRLRGDDRPVLMSDRRGRARQAIGVETARRLVDMMRAVVESGTGGRADLGGREAAGKTGTTQGARDAWFIGFTADYVAGVWMGNDDNTPLVGVTGGGLPAEIWRETMERVHRGLPEHPLPRPSVDMPLPAAARRGDEEGVVEEVFRSVLESILGSDRADTDAERERDEVERAMRTFNSGADR
jgi:membrane peptidoglycan carboxypeptidase